VYVVACLSIAYRGSHHLFVPFLQCRHLQCMQLIHYLLLSLLDDVSVLMVVCFVDFSVRGISVLDPAEGCNDNVSVFLCFVTAVVTMFMCFC
jgi:hypothetical protein